MITVVIFNKEDLDYVASIGEDAFDKTDVTYNLNRDAKQKLLTSNICVYKKEDGSFILLKNRFSYSDENARAILKIFKL